MVKDFLSLADCIGSNIEEPKLSCDPCACSPRFRFLNLIIEFLLSSHQVMERVDSDKRPASCIFEDIVKSGLAWFAGPVPWKESTFERKMCAK